MIPEEHLEFFHSVWSRPTLFTYIFLAANLGIFLLMSLAGGATDEATLMAFGVKSNPEIDEGQVWRVITPIFIHIGLLHLFFNSYALWIVGPQIEKLYGGARFVVLYVLTGVAGVLGSYFYHPEAISAGASGAIFGLFGVLLVFGVRYRHSIPPFFKRAVGTGVLPIIVINLIIGFTIPAIDNSAHISGLLMGGLLAAVIPFQRPGAETPAVFKNVQIALIAAILISFYQVAATYDGPRLSARNLPRTLIQIVGTSSSTQDFINAINTAQKTFQSVARQLDGADRETLAALRADVTTSIDRLRNIPSIAARPDELASDLLRVMQEQYDLVQDVERANTFTFAHSRRLRDNVAEYEEVMATFSNWVKTEGPKYGIQMGQ